MLKANASTGVMDGIITVDVGEDELALHAADIGENCEWHKVELGLSCLRQMGVHGITPKQASDESGAFSNHSDAATPEATVPKATSASKKDPGTPIKRKWWRPRSHNAVVRESSRKVAEEATRQLPIHIMTTIQNLLRKRGFSAVRPYLEKKSSLYLSDTGKHNLGLMYLPSTQNAVNSHSTTSCGMWEFLYIVAKLLLANQFHRWSRLRFM